MTDSTNYTIKRNDQSSDRSLKPWSAADEYLIQAYNELDIKEGIIAIYNDRFGFLSCNLYSHSPIVILTNKSQEKAIISNFEANKIPNPSFADPLVTLESKMNFALMKIPKSLGLFQLFLEQIVHNSTEDIKLVCAFMTRHFSPKMLQIAQEYFEVVDQSKALKKARLLTLSGKKKTKKKNNITSIVYNNQEYLQYLGVFSSAHIDYATQFFLDHIEIEKTDKHILDLASGNGILAKEILKLVPDAEIHLVDDSSLAVYSAELNIKGENIHHHYSDNLSIFKKETFDLIVTNPPFHFEYEINIQIALVLFRDSCRCLKEGGNLQVVANKHLNYKVHLAKLFTNVNVIAEDKKFIIYKCFK